MLKSSGRGIMKFAGSCSPCLFRIFHEVNFTKPTHVAQVIKPDTAVDNHAFHLTTFDKLPKVKSRYSRPHCRIRNVFHVFWHLLICLSQQTQTCSRVAVSCVETSSLIFLVSSIFLAFSAFYHRLECPFIFQPKSIHSHGPSWRR